MRLRFRERRATDGAGGHAARVVELSIKRQTAFGIARAAAQARPRRVGLTGLDAGERQRRQGALLEVLGQTAVGGLQGLGELMPGCAVQAGAIGTENALEEAVVRLEPPCGGQGLCPEPETSRNDLRNIQLDDIMDDNKFN